MDSVGDGVRRSARIWCHRLAEDEPDVYISLPGKRKFKKDSRTWLHKSSKRAEAKRAKEAKKQACSPVKGVHLISPLKDESDSICLDFTENGKDEAESPHILPEPKKTMAFNTVGKSFQVIQERNKPASKKGTSQLSPSLEHSNTIGLDDNESNDIDVIDKIPGDQDQAVKRNATVIDVTTGKKGIFRNIESVALSDSELCLRANRLALASSPDLFQAVPKHSDPTASYPGKRQGRGQSPLILQSVHFKSKCKRVMVSKVGGKVIISGSKKLNKTPTNGMASRIKPVKNKICSKHLKKKACKHLAMRSKKQKLSANMPKNLKHRRAKKALGKDKKTSKTSVSSQNGKHIPRKSDFKQLDKKSLHSVRKAATGDSTCDLEDNRCAKKALKRYNSFTTSFSECTIPTSQLFGGVSDIALGRSISEAGVSVLDSRCEFLQQRSSSGNVLVSGKLSRSADRLVPRSQSRKSLEAETGIRKRKGKLDDRSSTSSITDTSFQQKRSRDSLLEGKKGSRESKVKQFLSQHSSVGIATSRQTFSGSESSLQVQCSITTGLLDDTESCASSTVVEQGSFCSIDCCTSTGCLSNSKLDHQNSLLDKEDGSHLRTLKDQHYFNLTASPGNHCLATVNLSSLDLPVENDFLSAHKLHRSKALETTCNPKDEWELVSKSDSFVIESDNLIWK